MLRYFVKRSQGEEFESIQTPPEHGVWVYGQNIDKSDVSHLASRYNLDKNILGDLFDAAELPRIEANDDKEYIFLRLPQRSRKGRVVTHPILAIISGSNFFVLSSIDGLPATELIKKGLTVGSSQVAGLLLGTMAALLVIYDDLIDQTAGTIKDTGRRLKTHEVTNDDLIHFVVVEDNLNEYKMNLSAILGVVRRLHENKQDLFTKADKEALNDIILHVEQLLVSVDTYGKRVENIRNAYITIANNNLNTRIKILTGITLLVTLPNVFYGAFGMNYLAPYKDSPWAWGIVVATSAILVLLTYIAARRFKIF